MIKYPQGTTLSKVRKRAEYTNYFYYGKRGMALENDINKSNEYYIKNKIALIHKRPTPINVVSVDFTNGPIITKAFFDKQSTTDYNGVYRGKYIDFEAKSTKSKTSFPLANIEAHQINHLKNVVDQGGIAFFIIEFASFNEVYLLDSKYIINFFIKNERKSIPYSEVKEKGFKIKQGYNLRLDYISIVDEIYF